MDELWQRYRAFWTPVLWGIGAFLAGLIVVHILTDDPEVGIKGNEAKARTIKLQVAPTATQIRVAKESTVDLEKRNSVFARLLDQRHEDSDDPITAYVEQALKAAVLRGKRPTDPDFAVAFDGDTAAAAQAARAISSFARTG